MFNIDYCPCCGVVYAAISDRSIWCCEGRFEDSVLLLDEDEVPSLSDRFLAGCTLLAASDDDPADRNMVD